jgi:hypothetical protein
MRRQDSQSPAIVWNKALAAWATGAEIDVHSCATETSLVDTISAPSCLPFHNDAALLAAPGAACAGG